MGITGSSFFSMPTIPGINTKWYTPPGLPSGAANQLEADNNPSPQQTTYQGMPAGLQHGLIPGQAGFQSGNMNGAAASNAGTAKAATPAANASLLVNALKGIK